MLRTSVYNTEEKISTLANGIVHKKRIPYDCQEMIKKQNKKNILWKLRLTLLLVLGVIKQLIFFNFLFNMTKEKTNRPTE